MILVMMMMTTLMRMKKKMPVLRILIRAVKNFRFINCLNSFAP